MVQNPKANNIPDAQFNRALEQVQAYGSLPNNYKVEFQPSPGNGWRYVRGSASSGNHPLKDLSPSSPVTGPSQGPPRPGGLVPCVGHPPKYEPGSYRWRRCENTFEAVWETLVVNGAVDPKSKSKLKDSFITMKNKHQNLELYYPYDRENALRFECEEPAARLCRKHGRNLFLITFKIPDPDQFDMG